MRLCFISTMDGAPWGGSETLWSDAAEAALRQGHEVLVLTFSWPETPPRLLELERLGARRLERRRRAGRWQRKIEKSVSLWPVLRRWAPDMICVSQGNCFDLARQADVVAGLKTSAVPYVVVCQHNFDDRIPGDSVRHRARELFQNAQSVAFVSQRNREMAERQLAIRLSNATVIRNPVNLKINEALPWPVENGVVEFASVARLDANFKGQDVLFDVLSRAAWMDRKWRLTLYGSGPDETYLKELAAERGFNGNVVFAGFEPDMRAVWSKSHLQLLPSRSEGTPLSLVEALLCGRPAVVSDVGGNVEWIKEPDNGFVAEASSSRSFGAAMERAWEAQSKWPVMGIEAHRAATALVDPEPGQTLLRLSLDEI